MNPSPSSGRVGNFYVLYDPAGNPENPDQKWCVVRGWDGLVFGYFDTEESAVASTRNPSLVVKEISTRQRRRTGSWTK